MLSEQERIVASTMAPAETALKWLKEAEIPVKRSIKTRWWRVTYKTTISPKLNKVFGDLCPSKRP